MCQCQSQLALQTHKQYYVLHKWYVKTKINSKIGSNLNLIMFAGDYTTRKQFGNNHYIYDFDFLKAIIKNTKDGVN